MRVAAVDIGTNAVQSLLADVEGPGEIAVLEIEAEITRLGEGVDRTGSLAGAAMDRTLEELLRCRTRFDQAGVQVALVVGTSALRDADNRARFVQSVRDDAGFDLRVLTEEDEARYSFLAVRAGLALAADGVLVADVGGGSTELMWGEGDRLVHWHSVQIGSVRLTERLVKSDPITTEDVEALRYATAQALVAVRPRFDAELMVGMAGTFTTLVAVEQGLDPYDGRLVHGAMLARDEVERQIRLYSERSVAERQTIRGLDPRRADVILAGALLVEGLMDRFGFSEAQISDYGLNYGLVYEYSLG